MSMNMGVLFTAKDMASGTISKLQSSYLKLDSTVESSAKNFTKYVGAFAAGLTMIGAGAKILEAPLSFVDTAGQFQSSIAKMVSLTGFAGDSLKQMEKVALTVGPSMGMAPEMVITAMENLGTAGLNARQTLESIQPVLQFSGASQGALNLDNAATTFMAATNAFGLGTKNAQSTVDMLVKTTAIGTLGFGDMEKVIATSGSTAAGAGQKFSTFLASISAIKAQGGTATDASEKLRMAFNTLQGASSVTTKGLAQMGLKLTDLRDAKTGNFLQLPDLFDKIHGGLQKITGGSKAATATLRDKFLGDVLGIGGIQAYNKVMAGQFETMKNGQPVILKGTAALRAQMEILDMAGKKGGVAAGANQTFQESYTGLVNKITALGSALKIVLGTPLLGIVNQALTGITNLLTPLIATLQQSPGAAKAFTFTLVALGGALVTVGAAIAGFSGFAMISGAMATAGITISGVMASIGAAISTAFLPVLIVGGIVAAGVAAWQTNFGGFRDFVNDWIEGIGVAFQGLGFLFSKGIIPSEIFSRLDAIGVPLGSFIGFIQTARNSIITFSRAAKDGFEAAGGPAAFGPLGLAVRALGNALMQILTSVGKVAARFLGLNQSIQPGTAQSFGFKIGAALGYIIPFITKVVDGITLITSVVSGVIDLFDTSFGKGFINTILTITALINPFIGIPLLIATNFESLQATWNAMVGPNFNEDWAAGLEIMKADSQVFFDDWYAGVQAMGFADDTFFDDWYSGFVTITDGANGFFNSWSTGQQQMTASPTVSDWTIGFEIMKGSASSFVADWLAGAESMGQSASQFGSDWNAGFESIKGMVSGLGSSIVTMITDAASRAGSALSSAIGNAINTVKSMVGMGITVPVKVQQTGGGVTGGGGGWGTGRQGSIGMGAKMATGGIVPPGYPNDTYPAWLTSGEMVVPKHEVRKTGRANAERASIVAQPINRITPTKPQTTERIIEKQIIQQDTQSSGQAALPPVLVQLLLDSRVIQEQLLDLAQQDKGRRFAY